MSRLGAKLVRVNTQNHVTGTSQVRSVKPRAGINLGFGRKHSKKFIYIKFILSFSEELSNGRELPHLWAWEAGRGPQSSANRLFAESTQVLLTFKQHKAVHFVSQAAHRLDCTSSSNTVRFSRGGLDLVLTRIRDPTSQPQIQAGLLAIEPDSAPWAVEPPFRAACAHCVGVVGR